ncbi:hypothetical protein INR49_017474 [Caranx melampygus]|nr:hypothetical protein INR49_017474 [Caranx melampygus]
MAAVMGSSLSNMACNLIVTKNPTYESFFRLPSLSARLNGGVRLMPIKPPQRFVFEERSD